MLGARVGYWPCLKAPFAQVAVGKLLFDAWIGHPSYQKVGT